MKRSPLPAIGLALVMLASGCSGSSQKDRPRPSAGVGGASTASSAGVGGADSAVPANAPAYRLRCSEGGGFTGQWTGFVLEADGRVATWHGRDAESSSGTPIGTATTKEQNRLWSALEKAGFFTRDVNEPGNMTRSVRVEAAADTSIWSWSLKPEPDSTGRSTVWNACQDLVRQVKAREER
ncbi:MAG: hypothetical protein SGI90_08765 [Candidatus Eisenbacteria bacterium]|nr:hypothetical protein [Candidatus Eisenbacteria bacterium]